MNIASPEFVGERDDEWVPSTCALCYGTCSIRAHRVDGVVVKVEGNPESAIGKGRLCGKGVSGIMSHYDPNRLTVPLRRTNPKKGINEDPGWKEISWDEALDEIVAVLKRIRAEDPRKLLFQRTTTVLSARVPIMTFCNAFGTPNIGASRPPTTTTPTPPRGGGGGNQGGGGGGNHGGGGYRGPGWGAVVPGIIMAVPAMIPPSNPRFVDDGTVIEDIDRPSGRPPQNAAPRRVSGAPPANERRLMPDEIVIELNNSVTPQQIDALQRRHRLTRIESRQMQLTDTTVFR